MIDLLPEQKEIEDLGGTMRLGAQAVELAEETRALAAHNGLVIHERHRHRYEVNNQYRQQLVDAGLVISGTFRKGGSSRSWSSATIRGSWRASSTPSSSRARRDRRRFSGTSWAPPSCVPRARGRRGRRFGLGSGQSDRDVVLETCDLRLTSPVSHNPLAPVLAHQRCRAF